MWLVFRAQKLFTERYNTGDFKYEIPSPADGEYVLTLKFAEAWFKAPSQKVFDVKFNGETVVSDLDIFASVGFAAAHDEHVAFTIKGNKAIINGVSTSIHNSKLPLVFARGQADNPKICAILISKGSVEQATELAPLRPAAPAKTESHDDIFVEDGGEEVEERREVKSKPRKVNPYEVSASSASPLLVYVVVAVAVLACIGFWKLQQGGSASKSE